MPTTQTSGISYQDIGPYPRGRYQEGVFWGERLCEVASADAGQFISDMDTYPDDLWPFTSLGPAFALVSSAEITGWGKNTLSGAWQGGTAAPLAGDALMANLKTRVHLTYTTGRARWLGGYCVRESFEPGVRPLPSWNNRGLSWKSDGKVYLGSLLAYAASGTYRLSRFKAAIVPASVGNYIGWTNSSYWQSMTLDIGFAAGTLLYLGGHAERGGSIGLGDWKTIHHSCLYNPGGWNKVFRMDKGQYEELAFPNGAIFKPQGIVNFASIMP